mmetsp:Transcript_4235/g.7547  ORF Transcript_4235/g.7547 Transcript_4235/m.7547 type:complete len:249 (+) Transcript_4235:21-767(+)
MNMVINSSSVLCAKSAPKKTLSIWSTHDYVLNSRNKMHRCTILKSHQTISGFMSKENSLFSISPSPNLNQVYGVPRYFCRDIPGSTKCRSNIIKPANTSKTSLYSLKRDRALGIVIVDHGSKQKDSHNQLVEFVELFKTKTQFFQTVAGAGHDLREPIVEFAHMEIMEPSIEAAINSCTARGANFIVVAPYFLSNGRHVLHDVPKLVKEAEAKLNGRAKCIVAPAIGVDDLMVLLIQKRICEALGSSS